jgi:glutamyl-tRNA reductase
VLCIHTGSLSTASKNLLQVTIDAQLGWLAAAAEQGCSLVVLHTEDTIEFYTTEHDRFGALHSVMHSMAERVRANLSLGQTRTVQLGGPSAARRLFGHAAQMHSPRHSAAAVTNAIHRAAALSAANTALGPTLASLFRAAANVARRVRQETALESCDLSESLREIELLGAGRIVEEELATWQAQEAEILRVTTDLPEMQFQSPSFAHQEPASEVRLRIGTTIKPRISYILEPKRASSA